MVVYTVLQNPYVVQIILPFLLVFALVFAILQKSEILGKGKKQIDAIVSLVVGLIVVAFGNATQIIVYLIPILAVGLVILFVFMLLWGAAHNGKLEMHYGVRWAIGIVAAIAVITSVIVITGAAGWIYKQFASKDTTGIITNVVVIVIIIAAILIVTLAGGEKKDKKDKDS